MKDRFSTSSFAIGVIVGALVIVVWTSTGPSFSEITASNPANAEATSTVQTTSPPPIESGAISVTNQDAGATVTVESVTVPPPGVWIAIREVSNATLGNVLGAVRVTGPRSSVAVPLLRATTPGSAYAVELYRDNGDDRFDLSTDSVYVDFSTSEPVIAYFQTTASTTQP